VEKLENQNYLMGREGEQDDERSPVFKRLSPKKKRGNEIKKGNAIRPHIILLNKGNNK
jgi:hypothetical protein